MAHFRGVVYGDRRSVATIGSSRHGLRADINGWNRGIKVYADEITTFNGDQFSIYLTNGSKGSNNAHLWLGDYHEKMNTYEVIEMLRYAADRLEK